jgi:hypothetical protein
LLRIQNQNGGYFFPVCHVFPKTKCEEVSKRIHQGCRDFYIAAETQLDPEMKALLSNREVHVYGKPSIEKMGFVDYGKVVESSELDPNGEALEIFKQIQGDPKDIEMIRVSCGTDILEDAARLRAIRRKLSGKQAKILAHSRSLTMGEEDVGIRRVKEAFFALGAILGTADGVEMLPGSDGMWVLLEESGLGVMADAWAGSYLLETITGQFVEKFARALT